jgi:Tol biopolymer transport system component
MTGHDDFDRTLAGWFEADALSPAPAGSLDRVVEATRRRRPRPAWLAGPGSLWVGEAHPAGSSAGVRPLPRLGPRWSTAIIVLLVIVALVGGAILVGARLLQPSLPTVRLGHLAYGLDGDIFVADWDAGNPVRIADGAPATSSASCGNFGGEATFWGEGTIWSPDGQHLAYRSCGAVFISDPAGHVEASFPGTGWLVSWSPDSTRVTTWVFDGVQEAIGVYGLDGVRQALLTLPAGLSPPGDFDPVWSPDGLSLQISLAPAPPTQVPGRVWELPVDGRPPRPVPADDPRSYRQAASSPDGVRVAYVSSDTKPPVPIPLDTLVVAPADGSRNRVLVTCGVGCGGLQSPVWSPTGERIAFGVSGGGTPLAAPDELAVVDVASGTVTSLVSGRGTEALHIIRWSAAADRILFSRWDADNVMSLWTVRADGSDARLLVTGTNWGDWQQLPAGS